MFFRSKEILQGISWGKKSRVGVQRKQHHAGSRSERRAATIQESASRSTSRERRAATIQESASRSTSRERRAAIIQESASGSTSRRVAGRWLLDSGASHHCCADFNLLIDPIIVEKQVTVADDSKNEVTHRGSVKLTDTLTLKKVYYTPRFKDNLISVRVLIRKTDHVVCFSARGCYVVDPVTNTILLRGRMKKFMYSLDFNNSVSFSPANPTASSNKVYIPRTIAMRRTGIRISLSELGAREELPSTRVAVRLSGVEISEPTLKLNDLSQEIPDGVNKSAQAVVQAAKAGIRKIGSLARQQTMSMIGEIPVISIQPVVFGAAKKTSRAVGQATKSLLNYFLGGENNFMDRIKS